jgi:quinolinate synthase
MNTVEDIRNLAKKKNAIILAHNYQPKEIQVISDETGDSLELAKKALASNAEVIVFCGVHFMAESAAILSPNKLVLLPRLDAGCPMADMVAAKDVVAMRGKHPGASVVTYINSSAEVKAESDIICTSSNALKIIENADSDTVLFFPDKNLAAYAQRFTKKKIIPWSGFCPTHERFTIEKLKAIKSTHPDALVIVHPECKPEIIDMADEVLSTGQMINFVKGTNRKKIIVGTEKDIINRLSKVAPAVEFIPASSDFLCPNMKKISLDDILFSLIEDRYRIRVPDEIAVRARKALARMMELS